MKVVTCFIILILLVIAIRYKKVNYFNIKYRIIYLLNKKTMLCGRRGFFFSPSLAWQAAYTTGQKKADVLTSPRRQMGESQGDKVSCLKRQQ